MTHACRTAAAALALTLVVVRAEPLRPGLLFRASYDHGLEADHSAVGEPAPTAVVGEPVLVPGAEGQALDVARGGRVEYRRAGHIQELEGTISFRFNLKFAGDERQGMYRHFLTVAHNHLEFYKSKDTSTLRLIYKNFDYTPGSLDADIATLRPGTWHQVTLCWNAARIALFLDGVRAAESDTGGLAPFASDTITVNSNGDIVIDEVEIHDRPTRPLGPPFWTRESTTPVTLPDQEPMTAPGPVPDSDPMAAAPDTHLLFYAPFDVGMTAQIARGDGTFQVANEARLVTGKYGGALDSGSAPARFRWDQNLDPEQGTLSFWFFPYFSTNLPRPMRPTLFSIGGVNFEIAYWAGMFSMIARDAESDSYTWAWQAASDGTLKTNQWNHVAAQWENGRFRLRLNGKLSAMARYAGLARPESAWATLNTAQCAAIDELRIYDRAVLPWLAEPIPFSTEVETPHFPWARPYAGPRTTALVLNDCRLPVELAQRLDLDVDTVNLQMAPYLHIEDFRGGLWGPVDIGGWIEKKIDTGDWDTIVLGNRAFPYLNAACAARLAEHIRGGKGLVLCDAARAPAALAELNPFQPRDEPQEETAPVRSRGRHWLSANFDLSTATTRALFRAAATGTVVAQAGEAAAIAVREVGAGRVVGFAWADPVPVVSRYLDGGIRADQPDRNPDWPTDDFREDYYAILLRAALWTARHEPDVTVAIEANANPGEFKLVTENPGRRRVRAVAEIRVRDRYADTTYSTRLPVRAAPGRNATPFQVPDQALPGGPNRVAVRLLRGERVLDFAQTVVRGSQPLTVAEAELAKSVYAPDEAARVRVRLAGSLAGASAVARLYDSRGRLLQVQPFAVAPDGTGECTLDAGRVRITAVGIVHVDALVAQRRSDRAILEFFVPRPPQWQDYTFTTYFVGPYSGDWERDVPRLALAANMDGMMLTYGLPSDISDEPTICAAKYLRPFVDAGIPIVPQSMIPAEVRMHHNAARARWMENLIQKPPEQRTREDLQRLVCYNNPAFLDKVRQFGKAAGRAFRKYGPLGYNLQDEMQYVNGKLFGRDAPDCCFCEHCMQAMRAWLRSEYGALDALNAAWAAQFTTWAEVVPDTFTEARARQRFVSWADHRRFNEISTVRVLQLSKDSIRGADPDAEIQLSGTYAAAVYHGFDWWDAYKVLDASNGYGNHVDRGDLAGTAAVQWAPTHANVPWNTGYNAPAALQRFNVFNGALDGDLGSAFWWSRMLWRQDYSMHPFGKAAKTATDVLHQGLVRLTRNLDANPDRIAIHYSMDSHRLNYAMAGGTEKHFRYGRAAWFRILKECGLSSELVAADELEAGRLEQDAFRVLILPSSMAMSDREVRAVSEFAANGGIVIADYAPAIADRRLVPRPGSALAELFQLPELGRDLRFRRDRTELGLPVAEPDLPTWHIVRHGKGVVIYVNLDPSDYVRDEEGFLALRNRQSGGMDFRTRLLGVLGTCGVAPEYTVRRSNGEFLTRCVSKSWTGPGTRVLAILRQGQAPDAVLDEATGIFLGYNDPKTAATTSTPLQITLPERCYIYNSRSGRYLGHRRVLNTEVRNQDALLLSCLPYRVRAVRLETPAQLRRGAEMVCRLGVRARGTPGVHVLRLEWTDPNGKRLDYYSGNHVLKGPETIVRLQTAKNERLGRHRLRIRDAASGVEAEAEVLLVE